MLFQLKRTVNLYICPNKQKDLYNILKLEYENSIVTTEGNRIQVVNKKKFGMLFNSFAPDIVIEYSDNGPHFFFSFSLSKSVKILIYIIWIVAFLIGVLSVVNDGNIILEIFTFLICVVVSGLFGYIGLFFSSTKHFNRLKVVLSDQSGPMTQSDQSGDGSVIEPQNP